MLESLIDNIFGEFGIHFLIKSLTSPWEQTVPLSLSICFDIPMGTNCAAVLVDLFCSYKEKFIQQLIKYKRTIESNAFNLTFKYIDDINNPNFANWIPFIYTKRS